MYVAVACNASCQFGGICVAGPNICDCTSVSNSTGECYLATYVYYNFSYIGGTDDCYGGRANASCNCVCYDGLFTGKNCTGMLHTAIYATVTVLVLLKIVSS